MPNGITLCVSRLPNAEQMWRWGYPALMRSKAAQMRAIRASRHCEWDHVLGCFSVPAAATRVVAQNDAGHMGAGFDCKKKYNFAIKIPVSHDPVDLGD